MKAPTTLAKLLLIAVITGAATTGCATAGTSPSSGVELHRQSAVRIRNNNWSDVKVYLVRANGSLVRIGMVTSMTTVRIPLRRALVTELQTQGSLRFLIRPLGNLRETYLTDAVFTTSGEVMSLTVANQLWLSTLVVGSR